MAMNSMLTQALYLDAQPGGVSPELHLKEGCSSAEVDLLIRNRTLLPNAVSKDFYVRADRPDGSELFFRGFTTARDVYILGHLYNNNLRELAKTAGKYQCNITIVNTKSHPARQQLMNYDFVTVLPFTVIVHPKARRDENA